MEKLVYMFLLCFYHLISKLSYITSINSSYIYVWYTIQFTELRMYTSKVELGFFIIILQITYYSLVFL